MYASLLQHTRLLSAKTEFEACDVKRLILGLFEVVLATPHDLDVQVRLPTHATHVAKQGRAVGQQQSHPCVCCGEGGEREGGETDPATASRRSSSASAWSLA
jgi:hypothetical protein